MATGPRATFSAPIDTKTGQRIGPEGWRVELEYMGEMVLVVNLKSTLGDTRFASQKDANIAALALAKAGITTGEQAMQVGYRKVRQIMCEALPW